MISAASELPALRFKFYFDSSVAVVPFRAERLHEATIQHLVDEFKARVVKKFPTLRATEVAALVMEDSADRDVLDLLSNADDPIDCYWTNREKTHHVRVVWTREEADALTTAVPFLAGSASHALRMFSSKRVSRESVSEESTPAVSRESSAGLRDSPTITAVPHIDPPTTKGAPFLCAWGTPEKQPPEEPVVVFAPAPPPGPRSGRCGTAPATRSEVPQRLEGEIVMTLVAEEQMLRELIEETASEALHGIHMASSNSFTRAAAAAILAEHQRYRQAIIESERESREIVSSRFTTESKNCGVRVPRSDEFFIELKRRQLKLEQSLIVAERALRAEQESQREEISQKWQRRLEMYAHVFASATEKRLSSC